MLNSNGTAYANGNPLPKRFGFWFFGAGVPSNWQGMSPVGNLVLPEGFKSLEPHRSKVTLISNLRMPTYGNYAANRHHMGAASVTTGHPPGPGDTPAAASFDQLIAAKLVGARKSSIQLGLEGGGSEPIFRAISHAGPGTPLLPTTSPQKLFDELFGTSSGNGQDNRRKLRLSALRGVTTDLSALKQKVGAADRQRLDAYAEAISEIEAGLKAEEMTMSMTCTGKSLVSEIGGYDSGTDQFRAARNRLMAKITATALSCGITHVFSYMASAPNGSSTWRGGLANNHHELGHTYHADMFKSLDTVMARLGEWLDVFSSTDDGAGKLIDNVALFATSEHAGFNHSFDNQPAILAGGLVKGGLHVRSGGPITKAWKTVASAVGADIGEIGTQDAKTNEVITNALP
jgi:hypothetical protein